jgi:hypothetical protein
MLTATRLRALLTSPLGDGRLRGVPPTPYVLELQIAIVAALGDAEFTSVNGGRMRFATSGVLATSEPSTLCCGRDCASG